MSKINQIFCLICLIFLFYLHKLFYLENSILNILFMICDIFLFSGAQIRYVAADRQKIQISADLTPTMAALDITAAGG